MPRILVFTDLDGTLLDGATYAFEPAREALEVLHDCRIPLILVSSKTRAEMEPLRFELNNLDPFVVENGAAVYLPKDLFDDPIPYAVFRDPYLVIEQGTAYARVRSGLKEIAQAVGRPLRGFGDMSSEEIAERTGLSEREAVLAKQREYDEPFLVDDSEAVMERIGREADAKGLRVTRGGRFCHLSGRIDKGDACRQIIECYRRQWKSAEGELITIGLGDGPNDLPMLAVVDRPVVIPRPDGSVNPALQSPVFHTAPAPGPAGWNRAVLRLIHEL